MSWTNRITGTGTADPAELVANPNNYRQHPEHQKAALRGSLNEIGWVKRVIVNERTGRILDGHARVNEAAEKGEPEIPVVYVDLSEDEETKALVLFDPISEMANTDLDQYRALMDAIDVEDQALAEMMALTAQEPALPPVEDFEAPEDDNYKEQAGLIIMVSGPEEQAQVVDELRKRGHDARGIDV